MVCSIFLLEEYGLHLRHEAASYLGKLGKQRCRSTYFSNSSSPVLNSASKHFLGGPATSIMTHSEDIPMRTQAEDTFHNSEQQIRLILDSAAEAICGCDSAGTCLFANPSAARMLRYDDPAELLGKNLHLLQHHTRKDGTPYPSEECPIYIGLQKGEGVHRDDEIFWRRDGTSFPVEYWSHLVVREGRTLAAVITFIDLTERKHVEAALRKSEERNRSLLQINNAIITNLTQQSLLHSISETLRVVVPFDRCAITLYEPERDAFRFLAVEGDLLSDYFRAGLEDPRSETCAGWVFDHQRSLLRRDLQKEGEYANERRLVAEGIHSMCAFPLIFQGKCIGTLSLVSREKARYSDENAVFLQEVANQIVLAIQNMRSYQEIDTLKARLERENVYLREELRTEHNFEEIVGNSPAVLRALEAVDQVAPTDATVLIYGETGTGKELVARAIHNRSARNGRALVNVNCSAISAGLVESELFGHMKGAFTGALERRIGRFELAHGGTIFLDEIGELSLETQVKLLRVLQEHEFEPVGSSHPLRVDVRVIAATNRSLSEAIKAGLFRQDLFYRLNVFPIELPPLRERRSDIPQLVAFYVSQFSKRLGKNIDGVSRESMENLMNYPWPGNIRELQNVIERAVILSKNTIVRLDRDLMLVVATTKGMETPETNTAEQSQAGLKSPKPLLTLEEVDRNHILAALQHSGGVVDGPNGAAKILSVHPNTLRHRMGKLGIKGSRNRPS
jgi:formate hydrogenlyase transcriptional activator